MTRLAVVVLLKSECGFVQMSVLSSFPWVTHLIVAHNKLNFYLFFFFSDNTSIITSLYQPGPAMSHYRGHTPILLHSFLSSSLSINSLVLHCKFKYAYRALSWNLFSFYQHYFWFSRSLQSLYWHKLIRFNQLQTHSADRTLHLRYYDGSPSRPMFPEPWQT